jgi:acetyl esterase/lipase
VQKPDIAVFLPSKKNATGEAVIVCPGGGYSILAYDWEGSDIARWLNSRGITAFVLKYRLPLSKSNIVPHKSPLMDAQRAMRLVRFNAEKWNIDPGKIGIMGFSAGGHLASTLSTHFDGGDPVSSDPVERMSCRPDFSVLVYPVITFTEEFQHSGSRINLLGEDADESLVRYYSNELQVTEDTPRAILIHADDDTAVPFLRCLPGRSVGNLLTLRTAALTPRQEGDVCH